MSTVMAVRFALAPAPAPRADPPRPPAVAPGVRGIRAVYREREIPRASGHDGCGDEEQEHFAHGDHSKTKPAA
jgi:hypothetical protein